MSQTDFNAGNAGEFDQNLEDEAAGVRSATEAAPPALARTLTQAPFDRWLAGEKPVIKRYTNCDTFFANMYFMVVSEERGIKIRATQDALHALCGNVRNIAMHLHGKAEFGLVCYADTQPYGRSPNTPIALVTHGLKPDNAETIRKRLAAKTGVGFDEATQVQRSIRIYKSDAPLPYVRVQPLSAEELEFYREIGMLENSPTSPAPLKSASA